MLLLTQSTASERGDRHLCQLGIRFELQAVAGRLPEDAPQQHHGAPDCLPSEVTCRRCR